MTLHARKLHDPAVPIRTKDQLIDQFETHMQDTYLQYLDSAIPLHLMAAGGVRSAVCKMRLMAHHPSQYKDRTMPQSERDMLFATSMQMVEYDVLGKSTRGLDAFSWHLDVSFQIDALVFMLIASRTQAPDAPLTQKAWRLVTEMFKYRPTLLEDGRNELYAAVRALTLRAWEAREAECARCQLAPLEVPEVIAKLRERKERKKRSASISVPSSSAVTVPAEASALHQLAGLATQVDPRFQEGTTTAAAPPAGLVFNGVGASAGLTGGAGPMTNPFGADLDLQFDGMFSSFGTADIDVSGWAPVDWDYWNALLERNNVLQ